VKEVDPAEGVNGDFILNETNSAFYCANG